MDVVPADRERMDDSVTAAHRRSGRRSRRSTAPRIGTAVLAALLLLGACSGGDESDSLAYTGGDESTVEAGGGDEIDRADETADNTTATTSDRTADGDVDETDDAASPEDDRSTTSTTAGSGLPPVTTVPGAPAADVEDIYRGVLGDLFVDHELLDPVGDPPAPIAGVAPLTGLAADLPDRPAAVVKIDNSRSARPQTGLESADLVFEAEVEGGMTRLTAVFHSTPAIVGPVRSGRTTDIGVLGALGRPLFLYSGANVVTDGLIRAQEYVQNRSYATSSGYWRDTDRSAPSNVMTDTAPHWASADGGAPPPQFRYRGDGSPPATGASDGVDSVTVAYGAVSARWEWSGERWQRWQDGEPHRTVDGDHLHADNVLVFNVEVVDTGMVDSSGGAVPEMVYVGNGRASVFTDGRVITGTWTRATLGSPPILLDERGDQIRLTPGSSWIQLVGPTAKVNVDPG